MRCSCGREGKIFLERRNLPYCQYCFEDLLIKKIRQEAGRGPLQVQRIEGFYLQALQALCELAKKDIEYHEQAPQPGCAETNAANIVRFLLGIEQKNISVIPKSITQQELQTFFKEGQPENDGLVEELLKFEKQYPGTIQSINKHDTRTSTR